MTDTLQYDPRTKFVIKDTLYEFLYNPVKRQFQTRLDTIIVRNTLLGSHRHRSFTYKGEHYSCDTNPLPRKRNQLMAALKPEMDEYLKDMKKLNEQELPFVLGYINQVLNSSNNLNDYLRLLPDSVHQPIQQLIVKCPCQSKSLDEATVTLFKKRNQESINLMKQRQVMNLIT